MMGIFGREKKVDTKEAVRELQRKMRVELRQLDRQVHAIEREELKILSDALPLANHEVTRSELCDGPREYYMINNMQEKGFVQHFGERLHITCKIDWEKKGWKI
ncbi:unnamed protein product [Gongylonema pulchrum]|uniref:DUF2203 family protein n=1 Tax=Gongylonema pulchrum TaxID=637853 RepID=A0A183DUM8_9BILA|nr:unnamed protein product [Gongylonema pulchrum]